LHTIRIRYEHKTQVVVSGSVKNPSVQVARNSDNPRRSYSVLQPPFFCSAGTQPELVASRAL